MARIKINNSDIRFFDSIKDTCLLYKPGDKCITAYLTKEAFEQNQNLICGSGYEVNKDIAKNISIYKLQS